MNDMKKTIEYSVIGLFLLIILTFASILIYRAVIGSDWYDSMKLENGFKEVKEKLEDKSNIDYLGIVEEGNGIRYFYNFDDGLFSDMACSEYTTVTDKTKIHSILNSPSVTVFHKNGDQTSFFITDDSEIYSGMLKIECPSLFEWYSANKD